MALNALTEYDEYLRLTGGSDYYIDSHPMPGGTAFVEQFLKGKPCIGLKSKFFGYFLSGHIKYHHSTANFRTDP